MKDISGTQKNDRSRLLTGDTFKFDCHSSVACFTRCCKDADMYLYPYDVIRMKNRLGMSSDKFLERHTFQAIRDNPYFPNLMLRMSDDDERSCPFLSTRGCAIYKDRPFSCRAYPMERAVARTDDEDGRTVLYFVAEDSYCLGHKESHEWTVEAWMEDQQIQLFNDMNDLWVDVETLFRGNPWGPEGLDNPGLKMALMACFNGDEFKKFVFESTFLSRFNIPRETADRLKESDVELMKFGFDWVRFFLTGTGPIGVARSKNNPL